MTNFKAYLINGFTLLIQAGLFYHWQFGGSVPAGNIFRGLVVTLSVLVIIGAIGYIANDEQIDTTPSVGTTWFILVALAKMLMLLWAGAFLVYSIYLLALVLAACRRMENDKRIAARVAAIAASSAAFGTRSAQ